MFTVKILAFTFCACREDRYEGGGGGGYGHQRGGGSDYYHRGHAARSYSAGGTAAGTTHVPVGGVRTQDRDGGDLVQPPMMTFKAFLTTQVTRPVHQFKNRYQSLKSLKIFQKMSEILIPGNRNFSTKP